LDHWAPQDNQETAAIRVYLGWTARRVAAVTPASRVAPASPVRTDSTASVDQKETAVNPDLPAGTESKDDPAPADPRDPPELWLKEKRCRDPQDHRAWMARRVWPVCLEPRESVEPVAGRGRGGSRDYRENEGSQVRRARRGELVIRDSPGKTGIRVIRELQAKLGPSECKELLGL